MQRLFSAASSGALPLAAVAALASAFTFARRHPAGTVGASDRAPSVHAMQWEVDHVFPSTHQRIPAAAQHPDDAFEFGLRADFAKRELKREVGLVADALSAVSAVSLDEYDEFMLVGDEASGAAGFAWRSEAPAAAVPAAAK